MEKYQEIERSIIKKYRKEIWSKFVKAVSEYELIKENDNIMVCISGGKDSFLLRSLPPLFLKKIHKGLFFKSFSIAFFQFYVIIIVGR